MILNEGLEKFLESVKPQKISYGTNPETDNGEFFNQTGSIGTFFKYDGLYYAVTLTDGSHLSYVINELPSGGNVYEIEFGVSKSYLLHAVDYSIDSEANKTKNAIKAFSFILFIIKEIISHIDNVDYALFSGFGDKHKKLYPVMVSSRLLRTEIEKHIKFIFIGIIYDYIVFKRNN